MIIFPKEFYIISSAKTTIKGKDGAARGAVT